jgi:hypothetical protein
MPLGRRYAGAEQRIREQAYDDGMRDIEAELKRSRRLGLRPGRADCRAAQDRLTASFAYFAASALDLRGDAIRLLTEGFLAQGTEFARRARRFDSALAMAEIIQACRNAWTVCGLQPLLAQRAGITPSIVGYSLLYPYTDNFLDAKNVSPEAKLRFCRRFHDRLSGQRVSATGHHETQVWALVEMIESQYPRAHYPQVYRCLLAIHKAQQQSMAQLKNGPHCTETEILLISCAKGGTSVLADACLVRGWLSEEERRLSFDWGALLQLGDDLQDLAEDLERGSATLFTRGTAHRGALDGLVIQMLNFSEQIADRIACVPHGSSALKDLLRMSWRSLIISAVANAHTHFSAQFLAEAEQFSPFRFGFLRERNQQLTRRRGLYTGVFEALIETGDEGAPPPGHVEEPVLQMQ